MVISTWPKAAEWSIIIRRPVATCRYVTGVTNIVKSNRRAIDRYLRDLEYAGLIVGVAGMHRYDKALGSRQSSIIPSGAVASLSLLLITKCHGTEEYWNAEWIRFCYLGVARYSLTTVSSSSAFLRSTTFLETPCAQLLFHVDHLFTAPF